MCEFLSEEKVRSAKTKSGKSQNKSTAEEEKKLRMKGGEKGRDIQQTVRAGT